MDSKNSALEAYLLETCDVESELLKLIHRETYLMETQPHMISGHYQGRVLSFLSKLLNPSAILEIGTYTGYSTLCLAEGLNAGGVLHTIDVNEELSERVGGYFSQSQYSGQIHRYYGEALQVIPQIKGSFDMVFIDADKKNNFNYFEMVIERMPSGGVILIDNVLWKGRVLEEIPDSKSSKIDQENRRIARDRRVEKLILPIRDGLFVIRKR